MNRRTAKPDKIWIYLLPVLHFLACVTIAVAKLESGVHYLIYLDFPFSLLLVMLGWRHDTFLILFATLGTLWWLWLSWVIFRLLWKSE